MSRNRLQKAHVSEILRAQQKDDFYISFVNVSVFELTQTLFGARWSFMHQRTLTLLSYFAYYVLTTQSDLQTIGEEYVNIVQVDGTKKRIPSRWRRLASVLLGGFGSYTLDRLTTNLSRNPQDNSSHHILEFIHSLIGVTHRLHLGMFYLSGSFYQLSKRLANIHYVKVRYGLVECVSFALLGYLSLGHSLTSLLLSLRTFYQNRQHLPHETTHQSPPLSTTMYVRAPDKCSLCLEARCNPCLTPCGHLFCWMCIHEWSTNKSECPVCRDTFSPSRLVLLQNFDTILQ